MRKQMVLDLWIGKAQDTEIYKDEVSTWPQATFHKILDFWRAWNTFNVQGWNMIPDFPSVDNDGKDLR